MNKEKLFSLMPKVVVLENEVNNKIEEQREIIEAANLYVSRLSINRLYKKLADFDIEERLNLFLILSNDGFVVTENELYFYGMDIDSFSYILEENFNIKNMYELDNVYIENLLNGKDIVQEEISIDEENINFAEVLVRFVFQTWGMSVGDTPNLMLMLVVKKALLGSLLAEENVKSLLNGQREIYDISILM